MSKLEIKKSIEVNTNAAKTWEIIGPNFLNISDWARGVNKSWENENVSVSENLMNELFIMTMKNVKFHGPQMQRKFQILFLG